MDEFQDTNGQQARLLELVRAAGRFYAVGDINQSIFGFRHAEPEGFESYREAVAARGGRLVELIDNFRSRAGDSERGGNDRWQARTASSRAAWSPARSSKRRAPVAVEVIAAPRTWPMEGAVGGAAHRRSWPATMASPFRISRCWCATPK